MLNKAYTLNPDAFILDLEDSVNSINKAAARKNISLILPGLKEAGKTIFIRTNEPGSGEIIKDLEQTLSLGLDGYVIPKFETAGSILKIIGILERLEQRHDKKKTSLILMVESPKGILGLRDLAIHIDSTITERLKGIALGGEDYLESITVSRNISREALDPVKDEIIIFSHSRGILAIDTVFSDFSDNDGLRQDLEKAVPRGITSKLAIHPSQINLINEMFYPDVKDIERMDIILSNRDKIEGDGAISIEGIMYDMPHLKWAQKLKKYIDESRKG